MPKKTKNNNFKILRIALLLKLMVGVWKHFDNQKAVVQNWQGTQDIVITPINFDGMQSTSHGIKQLNSSQFKEIDTFFELQAENYGLKLGSSMIIRLGESIDSKPPALPKIGASRMDVILWSLKLRWWAWQNKTPDSHSSQINLFVMYSSPQKNQRLPHSTGLQKGLIGLIHASANKNDQKRNNMIITHELLHIFGASDKYNLRNGHPIFPEGFADPNKSPRFPQVKAEIMAGSIPITEKKLGRVFRLSQTVINEQTAREIGWIK